MIINHHTLDHARKWQEYIDSERDLRGPRVSEARAAAEVIQSLPDEWIDAKKLRQIIDGLRGSYKRGTVGYRLVKDLVDLFEILLPAPAPQVEIALGAWAMHPMHGEVVIMSAYADKRGRVRVAYRPLEDFVGDGTVWGWVHATDLSPLPDTHDDSDPEQGSNCQADLDSSPDPQPGEAWLVRSKLTCHEVNAVLDEFDEWTGADPDGTHFNEVVENVTPLRRLVPAQEPRVLRTLQDYVNAPVGTILGGDEKPAREKVSNDLWVSSIFAAKSNLDMVAENPRAVLWEPQS